MTQFDDDATAVALVAISALLSVLPLLFWLCISSEPWDEDYYAAARQQPPLLRRADGTPDRGVPPDSQAAALVRARRPPRSAEGADRPADVSAGGAARDIEGQQRRKHRVKAPAQAQHGVDQNARGGRATTKATAPSAGPSATLPSTKGPAATGSPTTGPAKNLSSRTIAPPLSQHPSRRVAARVVDGPI